MITVTAVTVVTEPSARAGAGRRLAALGIAAVLVLAGCSSADDDATGDVVIPDEPATLDVDDPAIDDPATDETPEPEPEPEPEPIAPTGSDTPQQAAQTLFDAWFAGDRETAATVAEPDAVDAMWQTAEGNYAVYNQCDSGEFGTSGCLFRGNNGTIQFTMERRDDDRWVVIEAFYSAP